MSARLPSPPEADTLFSRRAKLREDGGTLVLTNGCFDLLHPGHIHFLQQATGLGTELWVGLNGDNSVHALKGKGRPVQTEAERAYALLALHCVSAVFVFHTLRLDNEIRLLQPEHYAKAGDYTLDNLNPDERRSLGDVDARIHFLPVLEGYSTTRLLDKIRGAEGNF